jgi:hypothetical protein
MKKYIWIGVLLSTNLIYSTEITNNQSILKQQSSKILIIDLDKELEDGNKGGVSDIIETIIYIGHNDEVQFMGKNTLMAQPITIVIKDKFNKVKKTLINVFTIKTSELNKDDVIILTNRRDKVIAKKRIQK